MKYYLTQAGVKYLEEGKLSDVVGGVKKKYHGWRGKRDLSHVVRLSRGLRRAQDNPDYFIPKAGGLSTHADKSQENARITLQKKAASAFERLKKSGVPHGPAQLKVMDAGGDPLKNVMGHVRAQTDVGEPKP